MKYRYSYLFTQYILMGMMVMFLLSSCEKENTEGKENVDFPDISGFASSDEVGAEDLIVHIPFDNDVADTKGTVTGGVANNISFVEGRRGQAYKGSSTGYIAYDDPGALADLSSFTVAMWINKGKHEGGAEGLFSIPNTNGFWGNLLAMVEGGSADNMHLKFHFQKHVVPAITRWEQWVDLGGDNRIPNMFNQWKHIAFSYDETTSQFALYVNGTKLNLAEGFTNRLTADLPGGEPLGPLEFANVSKFIIGGFQQHLGTPFASPEPWMLNYTGAMDEFRVWDRALATEEVDAFYRLQNQGR